MQTSNNISSGKLYISFVYAKKYIYVSLYLSAVIIHGKTLIKMS